MDIVRFHMEPQEPQKYKLSFHDLNNCGFDHIKIKTTYNIYEDGSNEKLHCICILSDQVFMTQELILQKCNTIPWPSYTCKLPLRHDNSSLFAYWMLSSKVSILPWPPTFSTHWHHSAQSWMASVYLYVCLIIDLVYCKSD